MGRDKGKEVLKKGATSGTKRSRGAPARNIPTRYDEHKFRSAECQHRYNTWFLGKQVIPERTISLSMPEDSPISAVIRRRRWETLVTFPVASPSSLLKEFCANTDKDTLDVTRVSWVRGKRVPFDGRTIRRILDIPFDRSQPCAYREHCNLLGPVLPHSKYVFRDDIHTIAEHLRTAITHGYSWWEEKDGQPGIPEKLKRQCLSVDARFWHAFNNYTIFPSTNYSDVNIERSVFLYELMTDHNIDVGTILSDRIVHMVTQGRADNRLAHSSLIMRLCMDAEVTITSADTLDIEVQKVLDQNFYIEMMAETRKHEAHLAAQQRFAEDHDDMDAEIHADIPAPIPAPHHAGPSMPLYADSPVILQMQRQLADMHIDHRFYGRMLKALCVERNIDYDALRSPPSAGPSTTSRMDPEDHTDGAADD